MTDWAALVPLKQGVESKSRLREALEPAERMALASAHPIERLGSRWFQTIGGVLFIEAQKQIYAGSNAMPAAEPARKRGYVRVVGGTERGSMHRGD